MKEKCPFCGGESILVLNSRAPRALMWCSVCGATSTWIVAKKKDSDTIKELMKKWRKEADENKVPLRVCKPEKGE